MVGGGTGFGTRRTTAARLAELIGTGATASDAHNMAAMLGSRGYPTTLGVADHPPDTRGPGP